jgi:hypothetical protein
MSKVSNKDNMYNDSINQYVSYDKLKSLQIQLKDLQAFYCENTLS